MRLKAMMMALALLAMAGVSPAVAGTSCGVGVAGGREVGLVGLGGGIGLGSSGGTVGVTARCDLMLQNGLVVGARAGYSWFENDLKTIGLNTDLTLGARAGVLALPKVLMYGHVDWSQIDTSGGSKVNGWKFGPGIETRLNTAAPLYLSAEYSYGRYDNVIGSGLNARSDDVRLGLTWKFEATEAKAAPLK